MEKDNQKVLGNDDDQKMSGLNYIQETVLKKRKSSEEWAIRRKAQLEERRWQKKEDKKFIFKRADEFIKEHRHKELDFIKMKYRAKKMKMKPCTTESDLLFVMRIQGKTDMHPKIHKMLNMLGLRRIFTGVFLKASKGTLALLQRVEPYITYGYPNLKNVRELIFKKGNLNVNKEKFPLTDNNVIEQELGKYGILCIEDIVHEIANVGPHFNEISRSLLPFKLNKPGSEVLKGRKNPYKNGGDSGNREDHINELIDKMN